MAYFVTLLLVVTLLLKLTLDFKLSRGNSSVTSSPTNYINSSHFHHHSPYCIIIIAIIVSLCESRKIHYLMRTKH